MDKSIFFEEKFPKDFLISCIVTRGVIAYFYGNL